MKIRLLALAGILALGIGLAIGLVIMQPAAQAHEGLGECNDHMYTEALNAMEQLVQISQQAVEAQNYEMALQMMGHIRRQTVTVMAYCLGLVFQSEALGMQPTIGAVDFPAGVYTARLITNGAATITVTPESGECGFTDAAFEVATFQAIAPSGAETALVSQGCTATFAVTGATEPWLVQFEPTSAEGRGVIDHTH